MSPFVFTTPSTTFSTSYQTSTSTSSPTSSPTQDPTSNTARQNNFWIGFIIVFIFLIVAVIIVLVLLHQRAQSQMASSSQKHSATNPTKLPQRMPAAYVDWKGTPTHGQESGQIRRPAPTFMGYREVSTPAHWFGQLPREPSERETARRKMSLQAQARLGTPRPQERRIEGQESQRRVLDVEKPLPPTPVQSKALPRPPPLAPTVPSRGTSLQHLRETYNINERQEAQALSDAKQLFRFDF